MIGDSWLLLDGDARVARLVVTDSDFPWLYATLVPGEGFEAVRPLLEQAAAAAERIDEDADAFERAHRAIRDRLRLARPDGTVVAEFLLHVDGDTAWWRWSDVPFDD